MEGKFFSCGKNTLPQLSQIKQDDFVFDIQRFAEYDSEAAAISDGAVFRANDGSNTEYFKDLKGAVNFANKGTTTDNHTITLLANVSDAVGVSFAPICKITLDLAGHDLLFTKNAKDNKGAIIGKAKCFQITRSYTETTTNGIKHATNDVSGSVEIKNGTIGVANTTTDKFERLIRSYVDLTLTDVTLDGTNVRDQDTTPDGALLCHTTGILTLDGTTNIITKADVNGETYYALSGKLAGSVTGTASQVNQYAGGFSINVDDNVKIPSLALYGWHNNGNGHPINLHDSTDGDFSRAHISIAGGEIGKIALGNIARSLGGANAISITGGTFGTFDANETGITPVLVYGGDSTATTRNVDAWKLGAKGWNAASNDSTNTEYNYVAPTSDDNSTLGAVVLNVKNVSDKTALALDSAHSIVGVPNNAEASVGSGASYGFAYLSYNGTKDAVTVSGATENAVIAERASSLVTEDGIIAGTVKKIDATNVTVAASIIGNTLDNEIYGGGTAAQTFSLGAGSDTYVYSGGQHVISDYTAYRSGDKDVIRLSGIAPVTDGTKAKVTGNDLVLQFEGNDQLTFNGVAASIATDKDGNVQDDATVVAGKAAAENGGLGVTVLSGNETYVYKKGSIANQGKGVTLTSDFNGTAYDPENTYYTINGKAVGHALSITGDNYNNTIIGSDSGATLYGSTGNDSLIGGGGASTANTFVYSNGKDVVANYKHGVDLVSLGSAVNFTDTSTTGDKLTFKVNKDNALTFSPVGDKEELVTAVSLTGGGYLTKDGQVETVDDTNVLKLFSGKRGKVDISDALYTDVDGIDASAVKNQVVTMIGKEGGTYTFADNKKADVFQYGGGSATLNGYVGDSDKIDLDDSSMASFTVTDNNVSLNLGADKSILINGGANKEVLLRDDDNRSYKKYVFAQTGVLYDKAKNPTSATLFNGAGTDRKYTAASSIKKIDVNDSLVANVSIQAGDKNNTVIDASAAGEGVTLVSNSKNDKLTGSTNADTFIFTAGKDIITNYENSNTITDTITLDGAYSLGSAKITQSKRSVTLKFDNKNKLTIKAGSGNIGDIKIGNETYTFGKNAIIKDSTASLTSDFSGTYKVGSGVSTVDGSAVTKKNFTIQGTSNAESLVAGGAANKKTTLKGGGGADTLVGGLSQDTFFYAKSDSGAVIVDNFDYENDKLKIKRDITGITKDSNGVKFDMSGSSLTLKTDSAGTSIDGSKVLIKANNTLYWFDGDNLVTSTNSDAKTNIKDVMRHSSDYFVVDLNYSANLVKKGVVTASDDITFSKDSFRRTPTTPPNEG